MSAPVFEFQWFDYAAATPTQTAQILGIYEYVFEHDIQLTFDGSLDSDFTTPLQYYTADVRGAYGVIVKKQKREGSEEEGEEDDEIVGTVGIRRIAIPEACYSGVGGDQLPVTRAATESQESNVCELKRMFLLPVARGKGLSKVLLDEVLRKAREFGYEAMVLDTKLRLQAANKLYETIGGFVEFTDYNGNPRPDRFMIRKL